MNRYFQEVIDAHLLIQRWLGDATSPLSICEELLGRFSADYSMVTLSGHSLDFAALSHFFRSQRGAKQGLEIAIKQMTLVAESEKGAVVSYQEQQQLGDQQPTLRYSTVVFELNTQGNVVWRHLHETAAAV